jgi:hypothetical protein
MLSVWAAQTMYHWGDWALGKQNQIIPQPDLATRLILFERENDTIIKVMFRRYLLNGKNSYALTFFLYDVTSTDDLWTTIPRVLDRCGINRLRHQGAFWETIDAFQNLDNEQNKKYGGEVSFVFMHYVKVFYALLTIPGMELKANTNWPLPSHSFYIKGSLYL